MCTMVFRITAALLFLYFVYSEFAYNMFGGIMLVAVAGLT